MWKGMQEKCVLVKKAYLINIMCLILCDLNVYKNKSPSLETSKTKALKWQLCAFWKQRPCSLNQQKYMEERKDPLFYLCNALQTSRLCCSALSVLKKNEGGTNKATSVEPNQHLLCQQRADPPPHTHTQSLGFESSKEMPRNKGQVEPTRNLIVCSAVMCRGGGKEGKRKANKNEKGSHSLS